MGGRPQRRGRRPEHVEAIAADGDDVALGRGELGAQRRTGRPAAARPRIGEIGARHAAVEIVPRPVGRKRLVEHDAIVVEQLPDPIARPVPVYRSGLRLGLRGIFRRGDPGPGRSREPFLARRDPLAVAVAQAIPRRLGNRQDRRQRIGCEPQVGGELEGRDSDLDRIAPDRDDKGLRSRRVAPGHPGHHRLQGQDHIGVLERRLGLEAGMAEGEAHIAALDRVGDGEAQKLAQLHQSRDRRRIAAGCGHHDDGMGSGDQPAGDLVRVFAGRRAGAWNAELVGAGEAGAVDRQQRQLLGEAQIDRAAGFAPGDLDRPARDQPGVVLIGQAVVPFDVVAHDPVLVEGLLHPQMPAFVAAALHGPGIGRRRKAGGDDHRKTAAGRGVDRAAIVHRAAIDMGRGDGWPAADRREAERRVEAGVLVRNGDQPDRVVVPPGARLRRRLLEEADLRSGGKEQVIDPTGGQPRDEGVAHVLSLHLGPTGRLATVHSPSPIQLQVRAAHHAAIVAPGKTAPTDSSRDWRPARLGPNRPLETVRPSGLTATSRQPSSDSKVPNARPSEFHRCA